MRRWIAGLVLFAVAAPAPAADAPSLTAARHRWLRGNSAEARALYEALAKDPAQAAAAAVGLSRAWESDGEYDKAAAAVDAVLKAAPDDANLLARRAELHYLRGRLDDALKAADAAIGKKDDQFLARWVRARVYRDTGALDKADTEFRWFVRTYTARDQNGAPIKDADALLIVAQAGAENARWHNLADQFRFILNEVYGDALKADPDLWPAEYQAGALLLEKYNRGEARTAFDKALAINPRAAEALVGKGRAALQQLELKDAEQFAERALAINPRLPAALHLMADVHFVSGESEAALKRLEEAKAVNPRDEATLGRVAACLFTLRRLGDFGALCTQAERQNPKAGVFYFTLAERLDDRRLFVEAEEFYHKAVALWPQLPGAKNSLGLLALRMGHEDEARKILAAAFESDPFNVRVSNSIKVLNHLDKYETIKTAHFLLRYDPKSDAVLAKYMADELEAIYASLSKQFDFHPAEPVLIEVFNSHEMFSGRVIGIPDLHTIGACTGRMFAMVSPKGKGVRKPFNWGRVIRHELVHIFNLEQTNFQVPHWLTEGLAVRNEGFPRPPAWGQLLAERVAKDELLDLSTINLAFMRPRSPAEWTLAYAQSQLYVEYLTKTYGDRCIAGLLAAYRDEKDTAAAIRGVCGVELPTLEKGYKAYVREVAGKATGKPPEKPLTLAQLQAAVEKDPDDADLSARLAEQYWKRRRARDARELVEKVLKEHPKHGLALFVKAQLLLGAGEDETAQKLLEEAAAADPPEPRVLKALGKLYYDAAQWDKAAAVYERGRAAEPFETGWLEDLARVAKQTGDAAKRIAVLSELAPTDADEFDQRRELAELLAAAGRWAECERWAKEALEIDVTDAKVKELYLKALTEQGKADAAERVRKVLGG
ncbi:MAG TPA: tetratricopeptide repeat protein [Gemmataceae bacterium]|jgi:tetratricopeptide (TPR) repeat protein